MAGYTPARRGLTMLEMLAAVAIIGVLLGLALPALYRVQEHADRLTCQANLKNLMMALHHYHADRKTMPPYASGQNEGELFGSWFVHLLPYTDYAPIYEEVVAGGTSVSLGGIQMLGMPALAPGVGKVVYAELLCPSDPTRIEEGAEQNKTNYLANWYAFSNGTGGIYAPRQRFGNLTDGLSNVVFFGEGYSDCNGLHRLALASSSYHNFGITQLGKPSDDPSHLPNDYTMFQVGPAQCDGLRAQTAHESMNVALGDGSVRSVSPGISAQMWKNVLKPSDGELLDSDW